MFRLLGFGLGFGAWGFGIRLWVLVVLGFGLGFWDFASSFGFRAL